MCDKVADYYSHALEFVRNYYKTQKICDEAVDTYLSAIQLFQCYKTQKICHEAVNTFPFDSIPE